MDGYQFLGRNVVGKVLLVEDDAALGAEIQAALQRARITCDHFTTLDEAKKAFDGKTYHAVVTDIYLDSQTGSRGGLDLIRYVESSGIPTFIMSSAADLKIAKEGMNHGAIYLFEKPFNPADLIAVLKKTWEEPRGLQAILERFLDQHGLTNKEKEVVRLLIKGLSNKEIASMEDNSDRTIKFHLTSIFEKCGVQSRTELFNAIFPT